MYQGQACQIEHGFAVLLPLQGAECKSPCPSNEQHGGEEGLRPVCEADSISEWSSVMTTDQLLCETQVWCYLPCSEVMRNSLMPL